MIDMFTWIWNDTMQVYQYIYTRQYPWRGVTTQKNTTQDETNKHTGTK